MTMEDYNALQEILYERHRESEGLKTQIEEESGYIREAKAGLLAIGNLEPEDKKIFSPRRTNALYKEEIRKIKEEESLHEEKIRLLHERKAIVDSQITKIEAILEHHKKDHSAQFFLKDLEEIIDRIEGNIKLIDKNPIQARQDFSVIVKSLREIVEGMQGM